jgi:hypothetical protein
MPKKYISRFFSKFYRSIPIGYLNVIGFNIFQSLHSTLNYLLGVIVIEFFVILEPYFFLLKKLNQNLNYYNI